MIYIPVSPRDSAAPIPLGDVYRAGTTLLSLTKVCNVSMTSFIPVLETIGEPP